LVPDARFELAVDTVNPNLSWQLAVPDFVIVLRICLRLISKQKKTYNQTISSPTHRNNLLETSLVVSSLPT
jgi:hypothetical protein